VAEGARLESVFTGNRNVGSNPTPSARWLYPHIPGVHNPSENQAKIATLASSVATGCSRVYTYVRGI
jgi:hypothetical protein